MATSVAGRTSWAVGSDTDRVLDTVDARMAVGALWQGAIGSNVSTAKGFRLASATSPGVVTATGSPDANVHVATFQYVLPSSRVGGSYVMTLDTAATLDILTAHPADPSNPRRDLIIAQQNDKSQGDADSNMNVRVVTGTPAASPVDPTVTGSPDWTPLARVTVTAGMTTVATAAITDLRDTGFVVAVGGIQRVANSAGRPSGPFDSQAVYRRDTDWIEIFDGTSWRTQGVPVVSSQANLSLVTNPSLGQLAVATDTFTIFQWNGTAWVARVGPVDWAAYTPTLTNGAVGNGTITGKSWMTDGVVHFAAAWTLGSTSTVAAAPGPLVFSIPVNAKDVNWSGSAYLFDASTAANRQPGTLNGLTTGAQVYANGGGVSTLVPFTWATGDVIKVSGTYEPA